MRACPGCGCPMREIHGERDGMPWTGWVHAAIADFLACPRYEL